MEQFVAQFVNGSGVNEGFILHDVEDAVAHFHLNAHLEPLVVDVETDTEFACEIETLCYEVVDERLSLCIGHLVILLRGQVEFGVDAAKNVGSDVVVTLRAVLDVERELNEGGADRLGESSRIPVVVKVLNGNVVAHFALAETQRGDEAKVEIAAKAFAADDAHGEARCLQGFHIIDIEVSCVGDAVMTLGVGPRVGGLGQVLVVFNGLDGVAHLVVGQQETEMVWLVFVVGQVADDPSLGLCWNGQNREQQHDGGYFQCFFQGDSVLIIVDNDRDALLLRKFFKKSFLLIDDVDVALREWDGDAVLVHVIFDKIGKVVEDDKKQDASQQGQITSLSFGDGFHDRFDEMEDGQENKRGYEPSKHQPYKHEDNDKKQSQILPIGIFQRILFFNFVQWVRNGVCRVSRGGCLC